MSFGDFVSGPPKLSWNGDLAIHDGSMDQIQTWIQFEVRIRARLSVTNSTHAQNHTTYNHMPLNNKR